MEELEECNAAASGSGVGVGVGVDVGVGVGVGVKMKGGIVRALFRAPRRMIMSAWSYLRVKVTIRAFQIMNWWRPEGPEGEGT